ncbi:glycosyltransferase [Halomonas huangheensis]|uniref:Glycosyl transferase family 1 domain-containing protein n=1 Tax=Halomonas huangheensis TaxID=1178482 RepID=W1ND71_9GAMM|nr:glycosyltransferase [Halomonas huangheensis]ALM52812.1 hypothetical protein AR456_11370 [Halomonas huangheensis]ERL53276.1 hypothetical protein BJB45_18565 [Halomonas huangheensis]
MKDQRRFLLVLRRMDVGGIEQATQTMAEALANAGHEVHVLVLKGTSQRQLASNVHVHHCDVDRTSRRRWGLLLHLADRLFLSPLIKGSGIVWRGKRCSAAFRNIVAQLEVEHGRFDMILMRGQGAFENLWAYNDPRTWRVVEAITGRFANTWRGRWLTRVLYQGKQVISVSHGVEQSLNEYLEERGVQLAAHEVIYNAVPIHKLQQLADHTVSAATTRPYLVHVGRLVPVKNQARLLRAFHLAIHQGLEHDLVIIGDGSERKALESLSQQLALENRVHFLGHQANPYPWVNQADALVLSSDFEGLGVVLIEALALGTPCIACDVPGGVSEVLIEEQRRLLCAPDDQALADAMLDATRYPLAVNPQWLSRFTEERVVQQLLEITA